MAEIDLETVRTMVCSSLPVRARWFIDETPLDFDFSRAHAPLLPVQPSELLCDIEPEWARIRLFGEQDYAEGGGASPFLGVHEETGWILGLDVEREASSIYVLNSTIDGFIETFLLFDGVLTRAHPQLETLALAAHRIDPSAFPDSEWKSFCDYISSI